MNLTFAFYAKGTIYLAKGLTQDIAWSVLSPILARGITVSILDIVPINASAFGINELGLCTRFDDLSCMDYALEYQN